MIELNGFIGRHPEMSASSEFDAGHFNNLGYDQLIVNTYYSGHRIIDGKKGRALLVLRKTTEKGGDVTGNAQTVHEDISVANREKAFNHFSLERVSPILECPVPECDGL